MKKLKKEIKAKFKKSNTAEKIIRDSNENQPPTLNHGMPASATQSAHTPEAPCGSRALDELRWFNYCSNNNDPTARDEFVANSYLVSLPEVGHNAQQAVLRDQDETTGESFRNLLDAIALLFARYKPDKKAQKKAVKNTMIGDHTTQLDKDHTSRHVSAAALRKLNERKEYAICIAKNAGPLELEELVTEDAAKDEESTKLLEAWFNRPSSKTDPKHNHEFESRLRSFWKLRLAYCQRQLDAKRASLQKRISADRSLLRKYFVEHAFAVDMAEGPETMDPKILDIDLKYALGEELSDDEKAVVGSIYPQYREVCEDWKTNRYNATLKDLVPLADEFRVLLKHARLLATIDTTMDIFRTFRRRLRQSGARVRLNGPGNPGLFATDPHDIQSVMQRWTPDLKFVQEWLNDDTGEIEASHTKAFEKAKQGAINRLAQGPQPRNFHCELQLMDKFLDDDDVYSYIGCSKRSCWHCWEILAGTRFITQGTHRTVHWACAFPLTVSDSDARKRLAEHFNGVSEYLRNARNDIMIGKGNSRYVEGMGISQTTPLLSTLRSKAAATVLDLVTEGQLL